MNSLKMLTMPLLAIAAGTLLVCTKTPMESNNFPGLSGHSGLYGKLVDTDGKAVSGATVKALAAANNLLMKRSASTSGSDSVATDSDGYYSFETLAAGMYNLQGDYGNGKLVVLITDIVYDSAGAVKEVKTDTLRAPGQIAGRVNTHTDDDGGVLCYVPGTSYLSMTDDTGSFALLNIPQGRYKVTYRKDGLNTVSDSGIEVRSGAKTLLPVKDMDADPAYPPPAPSGLTVIYDTLHGCAILKWKEVIVSDLAGYVVYRNDTSSATPVRLNDKPVTDTVYTDTVFSDLMDTANRVLAYQLKAQDKDANVSTVYSTPFTVNAPSPTKVRTFITWKFINTLGDSASINDTVSVIASYKNATRKNVRLQWYVNKKDSLVRTVNDTALSGKDTVRFVWGKPTQNRIYAMATDEAGSTWHDSTMVKIVLDVPMAYAGNDTTVVSKDTVRLHGSATQRFGSIIKWEWKIGNGSWNATGGPDTMIVAPEGDQTLLCSLAVTDDDGNRGVDEMKLVVIDKVKSVAAGFYHSLILKPDGTLLGCGDNEYGQLGDGTPIGGQPTPFHIIMSSVQSMAAGEAYSLILKTDGTLWSCGDNSVGQLGDGTTTDRLTPVQIMSSVQSMAAGSHHSLILKTDGTLWACGGNEYGQLGNGTATDPSITPVQIVQIMSSVQSIAAGWCHNLILKTDGTLWACGFNGYGQLGDGTTTDRPTPIQIMGGVQSIAAGFGHSLILKTDGTLWACGYNGDGELGDGTTTDRHIPVQTMASVKSMAAGLYHSLILKTDGTLWTCGMNEYGQLGNGIWASPQAPTPIPVQVMSNVLSMAGGRNHTLILKTDGTLWGCGDNSGGQLGIIEEVGGTRCTPVRIILPHL